MNVLEWVAAIASISSVLLLAKGKSYGWILGIVGSVLYGLVFFEQKLYANTILQVIFVIQGFYGMSEWNKSILKKESFSSKKLDFISLIALISLTLALAVIISSIMSMTTSNSSPLLDTTLSICSILALAMMARRFIQSWFIWMMIDVGYVYLFLSTKMWVSAGLYFLLLLICIKGYFEWNKKEVEIEHL
jgi:nicotinamide mononucleotide transporter